MWILFLSVILNLFLTDTLGMCTHKRTLSIGPVLQPFEPTKRIRIRSENRTALSFCTSRDMQQVASTIFEVARPLGLTQDFGDECFEVALEWPYFDGLGLCCSIIPNMGLYFNGRNEVQVGLECMLDGEGKCAFTGFSAQDEITWNRHKPKQERFLDAEYIFSAQRGVSRQAVAGKAVRGWARILERKNAAVLL